MSSRHDAKVQEAMGTKQDTAQGPRVAARAKGESAARWREGAREQSSSEVRNPRDRLGPLRGSALSVVEERRLAPHSDGRQAPLAPSRFAGVGRVHIDAVRAAVQLRRPKAHQFDQWLLQVRSGDLLNEAGHALHGFWT